MPWEPGGKMPTLPTAAAPAAAPAATVARLPAPAARPAVPAAPPLTRQGPATKYVGTPAVGTSQAASTAGLASVGPENSEVNIRRRRLVWSCVVAFLAAWFLAFF